MSSAGKCPRRLAYAYLHTPESDPPNEHSLNRMALGHMAEVLIVRSLHKAGWETRNTVLSETGQLELSVPVPDTDLLLYGHPDGLCLHPVFTKGLWVPLECKSMSVDRANETQDNGVGLVYPDYIVQIALYGQRLHEMELVSYPHKGIFAMMDRDGRPIPAQRVTWDTSLYEETLTKVSHVVKEADAGRLPVRPYPPSSTECTFCPYFSLCQTPATAHRDPPGPPSTTPEPVITDDPKIEDASRQWTQLKPLMDNIRDTLQQASNMADQADIYCAGIIAGYFEPRPLQLYDPDKLHQFVPEDILAQCRVTQSKKKGFWIRTPRW